MERPKDYVEDQIQQLKKEVCLDVTKLRICAVIIFALGIMLGAVLL